MMTHRSVLLLLLMGMLGLAACNRDYEIPDKDEIEWEGRTRTFRLHVPADYNGTDTLPLVFVLHGGGGNSRQIVKNTRGMFNMLADAEGFLVCYPDGVERHWNDGRELTDRYTAHEENVDDVGYINQLIDHFGALYPVDEGAIFATGISNGGFMSSRLACDLSGRIAAIAPVVGGIAKNIVADCQPASPVSVFMINGTEDPLVIYDGNFVLNLKEEPVLGEKLTVPETADHWRSLMGCGAQPDTTITQDEAPDDGTSVIKRHYTSGCADSTAIWWWEVVEGGHNWPSGTQYAREKTIGTTTEEFDGAEEIWAFFKAHRR